MNVFLGPVWSHWRLRCSSRAWCQYRRSWHRPNLKKQTLIRCVALCWCCDLLNSPGICLPFLFWLVHFCLSDKFTNVYFLRGCVSLYRHTSLSIEKPCFNSLNTKYPISNILKLKRFQSLILFSEINCFKNHILIYSWYVSVICCLIWARWPQQ